MTTLYYMPGTCAMGIHVLLEEIGKPYDLKLVDFTKQGQFEPGYVEINPKSKVPVLERDDGTVLTEFPAISTWLALTNPDKKLLSTDPEKLARTLETVDYIVATLHMQAWTRFWRTANYSSVEEEHPKIKARGKEMTEKGLALLDKQLDKKEWLMGDFSIADSALYFFEFWIAERAHWPLPPNVAAHYQRMKARPSVQKMLKLEGLA
jgi:glutathione S-transferase